MDRIMNQEQFAREYAAYTRTPIYKSRVIVEDFCQLLIDIFGEGEYNKINFCGFGTFNVCFVQPKEYRDPKTGEMKISKGKRRVIFEPGLRIRKRLAE